MNAGPNELGQVNGDDISLQEYNQRVQYYNNLYVQQTGNSMTPEITAIYEQQVWDELVNSRLVQQKMDELGITVTDAELLDMVYGDNPDEIIVQNFSREDGTIDRATIDQVLTNPDFSQQAISLDLQLRQKRRQQKLTNYIAAGAQITKEQVEEQYIKQNSYADVSFVRFPFNDISDDEVFFFEGRVHGEISTEIKGDHGFGYDPIFLPTGQADMSLAQLPEWKNTNSHRAKALAQAAKFFQK
jgi:peptidyl-prolyl cis-trans isomerase D